MVIMDLLNYIKDFFAQGLVSKKRRAQDDFIPQHNTKYRKLSSSKMSGHGDCINLLDDLVSNASTSSVRQKSRFPTREMRYKGLGLRGITTINLDDEDDDVIIMTAKESLNQSNSKRGGKLTSTPNYSFNRSQHKDDDVTFLRTIEPSPENRFYPKKRHSNCNNKQFLYPNGSTHNGATPRISLNSPNDAISPIFGTARPKQKPVRKYPAGSSPAYRLDEKKIYKQLLMNAAPTLNDSFLDLSYSEYSTPIGKLFTAGSRGKKMVELATRTPDRKKPIDIIDLTEPASKPKRNTKLTTKETIKNVIDRYDNDLVHLNSDSSDVEVLPTPPSPKRDFHIKRINSLKTFVDPSEPSHEDWISNLVVKHKESVAKREREIVVQKSHTEKFSEINVELKAKRLEGEIRRCLKIKEILLPVELPDESIPLPQLTEKQEEIIDDALDKYADDCQTLARKFNMNIARRDLRTLSGLCWLNDEVINFYMNLIIERGKSSKWPTAHAMNTFFYPKMLKDGHSSIRRWTRKIDIFAHDIIVVPIHLRMHWCMAIIDFRNKTITYFDSMGSPNRLCLETLFRYLREEHQDKKKCEFDTSGWELINAKEIPQQMNGSDCGMFSCTFAEFLSRDAKITFSQEDMPYLRRKMVIEIIEGRLLIS